MSDRTIISKQNREDTRAFFDEMQKKDADPKKLAGILNKNPDLLTSKEFLTKAFPKRDNAKGSLGREPIDRMMKTIRTIKNLEAQGAISKKKTDAFLNSTNPQTGDTFATCVARNAVSACDKAHIDRSPKANLPEADKKVFADQQQVYTAALDELQTLGIDVSVKDWQKHNVADIAKMGRYQDAEGYSPALGKKYEVGNAPAATNENAPEPAPTANENTPTSADSANHSEEDAFEVGGEAKPLEVKIAEPAKKAVNVQVENEDENEATVENAPEEDKGKRGDNGFDRIKEQDIIDFMYNEWFLAGLSTLLGKATSALENSVDNLCEKYAKQNAMAYKRKTEVKEKNGKSASSRGRNILSTMPKKLANQFAENLKDPSGRLAKLHNDVRNNMGKTPQQWTELNPDNPKDKKVIDNWNKQYQKNPQAFMQNLNDTEKRMAEQGPMAAKIYEIAVEAATVQYMQEQMLKKHVDFINMDDKDIQAEIMQKAAENFETMTTGVKAIAEHTKLAAQGYDGITDPQKLENMGGEAAAEYLKLMQQQTAKAKAAVLMDVDEGNFKYNDQKPIHGSTEEVGKLDKLFKQSEHAGEILAPKGQDGALLGLDETARVWDTKRIVSGKMQEAVINTISDVKEKQAANQNRKQAVAEYKTRIWGDKKFQKFHNNSNSGDQISQIIYNTRKGRSGK